MIDFLGFPALSLARRGVLGAAVAVAVALAAAPVGGAAGWTSLGGGARHAGVTSVASAQEGRPQLINWPYETGGPVESSPVVAANGTVYVGSEDGRIYSLRANGLVRWAYKTGNSILSPAAGLGRASVYVVSQDGYLYALGRDGRRRWRRRVGAGSPPVVGRDGTVYVGVPAGLLALRPSGRLRWRYRIRRGVTSAPAVSRDGTIYAAGGDGRLHAVNRRGRRRWSVVVGQNPGVPSVGPEGTIYVGTGERRVHAISSSGRRRWTARVEGIVVGAPALAGRRIYVPSGLPTLRGAVTAFDLRGRRLWSFPTGDVVFSSPAVGGDGTVYFGSNDTYVYAVAPNGRLRWRYQTFSDIDSSPAIGPDGTLYIGSDDGSLYAFAPPPPPQRNSPVPSPRALSAPVGRLRAPGNLAALAAGGVAVVDFLRYAVTVLGADGRMLHAIGRPGRGPGRFRVPVDVASGPGGDLYVADGGAATVQQFRRVGPARYAFVRQWSAWTAAGPLPHRLVQPRAIAVSPLDGRVYVADWEHGIVAFTAEGAYLGEFSPTATRAPLGLDVGPDGDVYATFTAKTGDPGDQNSYRLDPDLHLEEVLGLLNPAGAPYLALDPSRHLYIGDALTPPVTKFEQVEGGWQELAFVILPAVFHYGLEVDAAESIYVPTFLNGPNPRGEVRVYRTEQRDNPQSPYRLAARWTGRRPTTLP
ncbi:MAG: PQQ-binding-like beta-propeller repeat protein [Actinomycetota bacterium]|nr:PQQ-binding-like beta-propeller repeat protein [Actinomycetota bacterium]